MSYYNSRSVARNQEWFDYVLQEMPNGQFMNHPWMFPGGADIDPALYGEEITYTHWFEEDMDTKEVALAGLLLEMGVPMLGICRGHQIITAAAGGTLYQDIWFDGATQGLHRHETVDVKRDSILAEIFWHSNQLIARDKLRANSLHHQATKDVPEGWQIAAYAPDGIIESIYNPDMPQVVSVQWHPEMLGQTEEIYEYLYQFTR